jgi:hypothetical protein
MPARTLAEAARLRLAAPKCVLLGCCGEPGDAQRCASKGWPVLGLYSDWECCGQFVEGQRLLEKPFQVEELLAVVEEMVGGEACRNG